MPYTKAFIKETFRLFPNGTEVSRRTEEPMVLSGFSVPAGTHVDLNPTVHFRDPVRGKSFLNILLCMHGKHVAKIVICLPTNFATLFVYRECIRFSAFSIGLYVFPPSRRCSPTPTPTAPSAGSAPGWTRRRRRPGYIRTCSRRSDTGRGCARGGGEDIYCYIITHGRRLFSRGGEEYL